MNCEQAETQLGQLAFGDVDEASGAALRAHVDQCEACREKLADMRVTLKLLRDGVKSVGEAKLSAQRRRVIREAVARAEQAKKDQTASRSTPPNQVMRRIAAVAAVLVIAVGLIGILLPSVGAARKSSTRMASTSQVRELAQAARAYAEQNNGRLPEDVGKLVDQDFIPPQSLVAPLDDTSIPGGFHGWSAQKKAQWARENSSYVMLGRGEAAPTGPRAVLGFEKLSAEKNGVAVVYGDGHAEWLDNDEARRMIERQEGKSIERLAQEAAQPTGPRASDEMLALAERGSGSLVGEDDGNGVIDYHVAIKNNEKGVRRNAGQQQSRITHQNQPADHDDVPPTGQSLSRATGVGQESTDTDGREHDLSLSNVTRGIDDIDVLAARRSLAEGEEFYLGGKPLSLRGGGGRGGDGVAFETALDLPAASAADNSRSDEALKPRRSRTVTSVAPGSVNGAVQIAVNPGMQAELAKVEKGFGAPPGPKAAALPPGQDGQKLAVVESDRPVGGYAQKKAAISQEVLVLDRLKSLGYIDGDETSSAPSTVSTEKSDGSTEAILKQNRDRAESDRGDVGRQSRLAIGNAPDPNTPFGVFKRNGSWHYVNGRWQRDPGERASSDEANADDSRVQIDQLRKLDGIDSVTAGPEQDATGELLEQQQAERLGDALRAGTLPKEEGKKPTSALQRPPPVTNTPEDWPVIIMRGRTPDSQLKPRQSRRALPDEATEDTEPAQPVYRILPVNPWVMAEADRLSTFALEADTASYTKARHYLMGKGVLPPRGMIRMEEFVNDFDYNYPTNTSATFSIHSEMAPSPFRPKLTLLKVGVKGRVVGRDGRKAAHLVFVVDTSGSMARADRLPLVKRSLALLVDQLTEADRVTLITYGTGADLVLESVPGDRKDQITAAVGAMTCRGSTNMLEGIHLGYEIARRGFLPGQINRVVLCSDGVANVGPTDAKALIEQVSSMRGHGVTFTSVGFGSGAYNDAMLEQLANRGDGNYVFVDSAAEARRVFVDKMTATLQTIAFDAKIQVEFDPQRVRRYRLIGYENRDIADKDFRNDRIDAGEIGSGQSATALYELELTDQARAARHGSLGTVFVRYADVDTHRIEEIAHRLTLNVAAGRKARTDPRFRLAACAAEFAELLRGSEHVVDGNFDKIDRVLQEVCEVLPLDKQAGELLQLVQRARELQ